MKTISSLIVVVFAFAAFCVFTGGAALNGSNLYAAEGANGNDADKTAEIDWVTNYTKGIQQAKSEDKDAVLFFTSQTCYYCYLLKQEALADAEVVALIEDNYVPIYIEDDKRLFTRYKLEGAPMLVFTNSQGKTYNIIEGYRAKDVYLEILQEVIDNTERIKELTATIDKGGAGVKVYNELAEIYLKTGYSSGALKHFKRVYALTKKVHTDDEEKMAEARKLASDSLFQVGSLQLRTGQFKEALASLATYQKDYPDHPKMEEGKFLLGIAYLMTGQYDKAKTHFETFLTDYPDSEMAEDVKDILKQIDEIKTQQKGQNTGE